MSIEGQITFRPAVLSDLPFLEALRRATMKEAVERHYPWDHAAQRARVLVHFGSAKIIQLDGKNIGLFKVIDEDTRIELVQMQLLPEYQNRGIASSLLGGLQERATAKGCGIILHVLKGNRAIDLYDRLGFTRYEEDQYSFGMIWRAGAKSPDKALQPTAVGLSF